MQIPNLRELRELHGLTQKELADVSGVSLRSVAGYEGGAHVRPNTARKLAQALNVEVADLVGADSSPKAQAPPSSIQPPLNGFEEERRDPTRYELNAIAILEDFCERLEEFLVLAEGAKVDPAIWLIQAHGILDRAALSLPLVQKESTRLLLVPAAARLLSLHEKVFEGARKAGVDVAEEDAKQSRELVRELTKRISHAA